MKTQGQVWAISPRLLVRAVPRTARTMQAMATVFGCPPEPDVKTFLLKLPYTLVRAHREIKLVLTRKLLPWWLDFIKMEDTTDGPKSQQTNPAVHPVNYNNDLYGNKPVDATGAWMLWG